MKKFLKKTEGFTLVELIVVIAILGILAGVGTVGYSGYIKKAQTAADQQLLAAVNQAFAAACIENGVDQKQVATADETMTDGAVTGVSVTAAGAVSDDKADKIETAFAKYFAGNENNKFKVVTDLQYSAEKGFYSNELEGNTGGRYSEIFAALVGNDAFDGAVEDFTDSSFNTIGPDKLMFKVDEVTGIAAELLGESPEFAGAVFSDMSALYDALNIEGDTDEEKAVNYAALMEELEAEDPNAPKKLAANFAVLQAAKNTNLTDAQGWLEAMKVEDAPILDVTDIKDMMDSSDPTEAQKGMSKAAMMYAMYTAYVTTLDDGSQAKQDAEAIATNVSTFVAGVNGDTGFKNYLQGPQAETDMKGYLGALSIINQSAAEDEDAVTDLIYNGYNDPALVSALQGLLGK